MLTTRVDDDYLAAAGPQLEIVANYGVGVDNIDLDAARRHGVLIANTPGRPDGIDGGARDRADAGAAPACRRRRPLPPCAQGMAVPDRLHARRRTAGEAVRDRRCGPDRDCDRKTRRGTRRAAALRRPGDDLTELLDDRRRGQPPLPADTGHAPPDRRRGIRADEADSRARQHGARRRSSTSARSLLRCRPARSQAQRSTCTSTSPRSRRNCSSWRTWC